MDGEVFRALPTPGTLVDCDGVIVDVNDAFLEYARQVGRPMQRAERVGQRVVDFTFSSRRESLTELLDRARQGLVTEYDICVTRPEERPRHYHITGHPLRDDQGAFAGTLILRQDVTVRVLHEARRQLLSGLHEEVWRMGSSIDLEPVLVGVREGLGRLGLPFDDCGVNLVDDSTDPPGVSYHNMTSSGSWIHAELDRNAGTLLDIWRAGRTAYRRDLEAEDPYGESPEIERIFSHRIRSVVDVPFRHGTFAVNSIRPNAFDAEDIALIEEVARTLGDSFSRLADLQGLETRNLILERTIAERRKAEHALRESEVRYRHIVDNLPVGVSHTAPDGRVLYLNPYSLRALGYSESDLQHLSARDLYVDVRDWARTQRALEAQGEHAYEHRCLGKDGRVLWMRGRTRTVADEQGQVMYYQGVAEDVTEQRRVEAENQALQDLREEVWRMERVADIDRVITAVRVCLDVLAIDAEGCSVHVIDDETDPPGVTSFRNRRGETAWVRSSSDGVRDAILSVWRAGKPLYREDLQTQDDFDETARIRDNFGTLIRSVLDVPFSRGTLAVNNTRPAAFSDRDVEVVSRIAEILSTGFLRLADFEQLERHNRQLQAEIAERRDLESQLRRSQKMEAVGQLTAGLAHNFNNILQAIVGNLELARRAHADEQAPLLRDAEEAGHRAAEIIEQMMVFSRRDERKAMSTVNVAELLRQTVDICRRTFDRRIDVTVDVPAEVPAVLGSRGELEQVLLNLLINARDAIRDVDNPEIRIVAQARWLGRHQLARPEVEPGQYVAIVVRDNGRGISKEDLGRLFDPFFTTKGVGEGTGLGLFTAYGIINGLGGWIECDSSAGAGATFTVILPEGSIDSVETEAEQASDVPRVGTILVIDDEEVVRTTVQRMLESFGHTVLAAEDGPTGLEIIDARGQEIDMVLLDLSMPRMSGAEVYRQIQQRDHSPPVMILTGFAGAEQKPEGARLMQKPFTMQSLALAVEGMFDAQTSS